jgi:tetratricopeptide (TPR) repeat protein
VETLWTEAVRAHNRLAEGELAAFPEFTAAFDGLLAHPGFDRLTWESRADILDRASTAYRIHFQQHGSLDDLDRAVDLARTALGTRPAGSPGRHAPLGHLASALLDRYKHAGSREDLDDAIALCRDALQSAPETAAERATQLNRLGTALMWRHSETLVGSDLSDAVSTLEAALSEASAGAPDQRALILTNLSGALLDQYEIAREKESILDRAIRLQRQALREAPADSNERALYISSLGSALTKRFIAAEASDDIEEALALLRGEDARRATRNNNDSFLIAFALAQALECRYLLNRDSADLTAAIKAGFTAFGAAPEESHKRLDAIVMVALLLNRQFELTAHVADLDALVEALRIVGTTTAPEHRLHADYQNKLGTGLLTRWRLTGRASDLDEGIVAYDEAVSTAQAGSRRIPTYLANLGNALRLRAERTQSVGDIDAAIDVQTRALAHKGEMLRDDARHAFGLALAFMLRFRTTGQVAALDQAISTLERIAVDEAAPPAYLDGLGNAMLDRYELNREVADLDRAIELLTRALDAQERNTPDEARLARTLSAALATKAANVIRSAESWDPAIEMAERAWRALGSAHTDLSLQYRLGRQEELSIVGTLLTDVHLRHCEAIEEAREKEASSADKTGASLRRAMVVAEGVKARLLSELVGRSSSRPPAGISDTLLRREREQLDILTTIDLADLARGEEVEKGDRPAARLDRAFNRDVATRTLTTIWREIEQLGPDAADYVSQRRGDVLDWDSLAMLATQLGPDTILVSQFDAHDRAQLFVLRAGAHAPALCQVDLPDSSWGDIRHRVFREIASHDGTDRSAPTWGRLLVPLLAQARPHLAGAKRVVFSPRGLGNLLPWSAATQQARWQMDTGAPMPLVIVPTLNILSHLLTDVGTSPLHVRASTCLVVGNPTGDLPYSDGEAREVAALFGVKPLIGPDADRRTVLEELSRADVVHLATHARFSGVDPLASEIVLADGSVTAREILQQRVNAKLIVLSACETGQSATMRGDELAGMSQAFLQAGARTLVASLWRVSDPATAELMTEFYRTCDRGADKAEALSLAAARMRANAGTAHPFFWGAFMLIGDWR